MAIIHYHNSCKSYNYLYCCRSYNYQPASILQRYNALLQRRPHIFSVTDSSMHPLTLLSCRTKAVIADSGTNNRCHFPNPHFTQALKAKQTATDSGTYLYLAVLDDGCADAALLLRPQPWLGSRADPGSNRGPDLARYRAPATDRVRNCRSCKRGMQWEAMGRVQDAGWVAGVTCKIATMALKILVEAPGFRCSSSCSQKCRIGWH